jgi:hypothetical protein
VPFATQFVIGFFQHTIVGVALHAQDIVEVTPGGHELHQRCQHQQRQQQQA